MALPENNFPIKNNVKIIFRYNAIDYVTYYDDYGDSMEYMFEDGNYSCDCNRSLFIQRQCDEDFPDMKCGDTIEMVSFERLKARSLPR